MKKIIINSSIIFAMCFIFHFAYQVLPNFITSIISPVNESIYEHFKMLFMTTLIFSLFEKTNKKNTNNLYFKIYLRSMLSTTLLCIIYLPIYNLIGENMPVTIFILFISILLTEIVISKISIKKHFNILNILSVTFLIIDIILLTYLTYFPPHTSLFYDTNDKIYGIKTK